MAKEKIGKTQATSGMTLSEWVKRTTPQERNEGYNLLFHQMLNVGGVNEINGATIPPLTDDDWTILAYGVFRDGPVIDLGGPTDLLAVTDVTGWLDFVDKVYEPYVASLTTKASGSREPSVASNRYTLPGTHQQGTRADWLSRLDLVGTEQMQIPLTVTALTLAGAGAVTAAGGTIVGSGTSATALALAEGGAATGGLATGTATIAQGLGTAAGWLARTGARTTTNTASPLAKTVARGLMKASDLIADVLPSITGGLRTLMRNKVVQVGIGGVVGTTLFSAYDNLFNPEANEAAEAAAETQARNLNAPDVQASQSFRGTGDQATPVIELRDAAGKLVGVERGVLANDPETGQNVVLPTSSPEGTYRMNPDTGTLTFIPTGVNQALGDTPPGIADEDKPWPFLGVEPGYQATRRVPNSPVTRDTLFEGGTPGYTTRKIDPVYKAIDAEVTLNQMGDSALLDFQKMMVDAGLIDEFGYYPGIADAATEDAMIAVMGQANQDGTHWQSAAMAYQRLGLRQREAAKLAAFKARTFVAPAYVAPDYASLSQAVKQTFSSLVGRDPHDYELSLLADTMNKDYRSQYQAEVGAQRAEFDAQGRAIMDETSQAAGTVQGVDPAARLMETIETKYAGEIEAEESEDKAVTDVSNILNSFSRLTAFTRGG